MKPYIWMSALFLEMAPALAAPSRSLPPRTPAQIQELFQNAQAAQREVATLAGGCFWGLEELMRAQPGVIETQVGYSGGKTMRPTYETVSKGNTGHAESVQILFDPRRTSFESLLLAFFRIHDPTTLNRQGNDIGTQYRSAIFFHGSAQEKVARDVAKRVARSGDWRKPVVTEISPFTSFWRAEEHNQKYLVKNPGGYTCHFDRGHDF